jgi:ABC-type transporter Mla MlaB component
MLIDDGLELLSEEECRDLLEQEALGRVGVSVEALPAIFPVNYSMVEGDILFRTGEGIKLRAALSHTIVAFEVDHSDPDRREGWSVLVVGVAERLPAQTDGLGVRVGPAPWAGGDRGHLIRIRPELISGRRIVHHDGRAADTPPGALQGGDVDGNAPAVTLPAVSPVNAAVHPDHAGHSSGSNGFLSSHHDPQPGVSDLDPALEVWVQREAAATIVTVRGRLDDRTAASLSQVVHDLTSPQSGTIRVDLRQLDRRTSAGVRRLQQLLTQPNSRGRSIHLLGTTSKG